MTILQEPSDAMWDRRVYNRKPVHFPLNNKCLRFSSMLERDACSITESREIDGNAGGFIPTYDCTTISRSFTCHLFWPMYPFPQQQVNMYAALFLLHECWSLWQIVSQESGCQKYFLIVLYHVNIRSKLNFTFQKKKEKEVHWILSRHPCQISNVGLICVVSTLLDHYLTVICCVKTMS